MSHIAISFGGRSIYLAKPASYDELLRIARLKFSIGQHNQLTVRYHSTWGGVMDLDPSAYPAVESNTRLDLELLQESGMPQGRESSSQTMLALRDTRHATSVSGTRSCSESEEDGEPVFDTSDFLAAKMMKKEAEECEYDEEYTMMGREKAVVASTTPDHPPLITIHIKTQTGKTIGVVANSWDLVEDLKQQIDDSEDIPVEEQRLVFAGKQLDDDRTLEHYDIQSGATIHLVLRLMGGKPAIYLLAPEPLENVMVSVSLRGWRFSTLYPPADVQSDNLKNTQTVSWLVSTHDDGTLYDETSGMNCAYLYWEAEAIAKSAAAQRSHNELVDDDSAKYFDPAAPLINASNSEAVVSEEFVEVLDGLLQKMCLTTTMRNDFIVYWLPKIQKLRDRHHYIAFRFVNQRAFNRAATLTVHGPTCPRPAEVARIFLLFGGVDKEDVEGYQIFVPWAERIGLNVEAMRDQSAFRVLEWGGMEVQPTKSDVLTPESK